MPLSFLDRPGARERVYHHPDLYRLYSISYEFVCVVNAPDASHAKKCVACGCEFRAVVVGQTRVKRMGDGFTWRSGIVGRTDDDAEK